VSKKKKAATDAGAPKAPAAKSAADNGKPKVTQATLVLELVEKLPLGKTQKGTVVLKIGTGEKSYTIGVGTDRCNGWLANAFHQKHGTVPAAQALKQAMGVLVERASILRDGGQTAAFETASEIFDEPADATVPTGPSAGGSGGAESQVDVLLELVDDIEFFHTPDDTAFACFESNGHRENHPLRSKRFKRQVLYRYFKETGGAPGPQALDGAIAVLEARALFEGPELEVHLRVAEHDGRIYIDLASAGWEAVEISTSGWRVMTDPPVRFWRTRGMQALPRPVTGGSINELRPFINVPGPPVTPPGDSADGIELPVDSASDDAWHLLLGWFVSALRPRGPFVLLVVQGGQGAAKSTACRIIRALVDPSTAPLRRLPRDEQNLAIAAHNAWLLVFDNVSGLADWTSDALCTVATGGGLATRELYSDTDEVLFNACRPMVANGIDDVATRPDLADRSILLVLAPIDEATRRDEQEFWAAFETARPGILGALFDAVSVALRELPNVRLTKKPRMADFAKWATAAESAFGSKAGTFLGAYMRKRDASLQVTVDADVVAPLVVELLRMPTLNGVWQGSATKLYGDLQAIAPVGVVRSRKWPKAANALSKHLRNRGAVPLAHAGVILTDDRVGADGRRELRLELRPPVTTDSTTDGSDEQVPVNGQPDGTVGATDGSAGASRQSQETTQPPVITVDFVTTDSTDGTDGSSPGSKSNADAVEETI
jgi:hypothetical protein